MNNLYIIEGTSNSGKTTTSKYLSEYPSVLTIPEFMDHPLSPKPSKTLEEELHNQIIFLKIEKERMEKAKLLLNMDKIVFLERSFISILAVSYAFKKLGKYNGYDNAMKLYNNMINEDWYLPPEVIYILTASHEEKIKRNKKRQKELSDNWVQDKFEFYQDEFYDKILIEPKKVFIDTSGKEDEYAAKTIIRDLKKGR